jgi:hypothetical protein
MSVNVKHIVLDASAIVASPELLALDDPGIKLYASSEAEDEFRRWSSGLSPQRLKIPILDLAKSKGTLTVLPGPLSILEADQLLRNGLSSDRLSSPDRSTIALAISVKQLHPNAEVWVISLRDPIMRITDPRLDIRIPYFMGYRVLSNARHDPQIFELVRRLRTRNSLALFYSVVIAIVLLLVAIFGLKNITAILFYLGPIGFIGALPLIALALFWLRVHYRLTYGIFGFLVGISVIGNTVLADQHGQYVDFQFLLQIIGGLYVMVRGLDNIGTALDRTSYQKWWRKFFTTPYDAI